MCKKRTLADETRLLDIGMDALGAALEEAKRTLDVESLLHIVQLTDALLDDDRTERPRPIGFVTGEAEVEE